MRAWARLIGRLTRKSSAGALSTPAELDPRAAGRALARTRHERDRDKIRAMANQIRADLRAKGRDLPPINWDSLT